MGGGGGVEEDITVPANGRTNIIDHVDPYVTRVDQKQRSIFSWYCSGYCYTTQHLCLLCKRRERVDLCE